MSISTSISTSDTSSFLVGSLNPRKANTINKGKKWVGVGQSSFEICEGIFFFFFDGSISHKKQVINNFTTKAF